MASVERAAFSNHLEYRLQAESNMSEYGRLKAVLQTKSRRSAGALQKKGGFKKKGDERASTLVPVT